MPVCLIMLTPWHPFDAAVKHFTDDNGTIHITNNPKDKALIPQVDAKAPDSANPPEMHKPQKPTPWNILPRQDTANTPLLWLKITAVAIANPAPHLGYDFCPSGSSLLVFATLLGIMTGVWFPPDLGQSCFFPDQSI